MSILGWFQWRRSRRLVDVTDVHMTMDSALNSATANAAPEDRNDLMNHQVISRDTNESDEAWLERTMRLLGPLYEEE